LLIVIALVSLLAALMIPSLSGVTSYYRNVQCKNNLNRLGQGFVMSSNIPDAQKGHLAISAPGSKGQFPTGMVWPSVPRDAVEEIQLYQCPEDEVKQASIQGSLKSLEYESHQGIYSLETVGDAAFYKSRRGRDSKGPYTEYLMQDDDYSNGQYARMNFNGWIDTDGVARVYDSGEILVFSNLISETAGSVPDWTNCSGPGYPNRVNTCGNPNIIRYMGEPSLGGNGRMQDARGQTFKLANWGERMTNYGINTYAYRYDSGGGCIVLVDYQESMADVNYPQAVESLLLQSARHSGKVNYLMADGSVGSGTPFEISPRLHPQKWRP